MEQNKLNNANEAQQTENSHRIAFSDFMKAMPTNLKALAEWSTDIVMTRTNDGYDIETETDAMLADPLTFFQDIKSEYDSGEIDERTAYLRIVSAHLFMLAQTCAAPPPVMLGIDIHHDVYMGAIEKIRLCVDYAFDNMDEFPGEARKALTTIDEIVEKTGVQFSEDDLPESLKALAANAKPLNGDNITDNLGDILCAVLGGMSNTGV